MKSRLQLFMTDHYRYQQKIVQNKRKIRLFCDNCKYAQLRVTFMQRIWTNKSNIKLQAL